MNTNPVLWLHTILNDGTNESIGLQGKSDLGCNSERASNRNKRSNAVPQYRGFRQGDACTDVVLRIDDDSDGASA